MIPTIDSEMPRVFIVSDESLEYDCSDIAGPWHEQYIRGLNNHDRAGDEHGAAVQSAATTE